MSYNQPVGDTSLIACLHCDLLQRIPELAPGASARCPRCDKELWRRRVDSLNRTLALTVGATLLYVVANSVPMLGTYDRRAGRLDHGDRRRRASMGERAEIVASAGAVHRRRRAGAANRIHAGDSAWSACGRGRLDGWERLLRHHPTTRIWSMIEVMMLGVLVALGQDCGLRDGDSGDGAVRALGAGLPARRDAGELRLARGVGADPVGRRRAQRDVAGELAGRGNVVSGTGITAMQQGPAKLRRLAACSRVQRRGEQEGRCPRCDEELEFRKARQLSAHLGFPDRRGGLLHPGQRASRA